MTETIRVEDGKFLVESYETSDNEIVSYFSEISPENIEDNFTTSLRVGVVALNTIGTTEKIDYIEKAFYKLKNNFDEVLIKTSAEMESQMNEIFGENGVISTIIDEQFGEKGALSKIIDEHLGEEGVLSKIIDKYFGEEGTISKIIDEHFGEDGKLIKEVFDPAIKDTPLFNLRSLITDEISRLRKELSIKEAKEEVKAATPLKGYDFEDLCEELVGDIIKAHFGDEFERTTDVIGKLSGSKKGDFVITLSERPDCKIVLETKDRENVTLPKIHKEMKEALENRDAKYGIYVVKWVESLPKGVGCFNEYQGNHLVCALTSKEHEGIIHPEILNVAVCWARNRALLEIAEIEGLDVSLIQEKLKKAMSKLKKFSRIKTECTNVEKSVKTIRFVSDEIRDEINIELEAIRDEIVRVMGERISSQQIPFTNTQRQSITKTLE